VTGANSGIGYESARAFASAGGEVIIAGRTEEKDRAAQEAIKRNHPDASLHVMKLDLASLDSIKQFADRFLEKFDRLDILMNNAGIMMSPNFSTADGFEGQTGINHLGHFALTGRLLEIIHKTENSRVVTVSSLAHKRGDGDFSRMVYSSKGKYSSTVAYGRSKLANLLFTYELDRFFKQHHSSSLAVAAHPGITKTSLSRYIEKNIAVKLLMPLFSRWAMSPEQGALPQIRAAVDPRVEGGEYFGPDGRREYKGFPVQVSSNSLSHSEALATKLWRRSEELTGVNFRI
jgi:NAD(P)-dependent dehydrogenase (short-subunit alcohol dehydrogenase family)